MKVIFWDTNILLDYYDNRSGAAAAELMLRLAYAGKLSICCSVLTFANFAYIARHNHSIEEIYSSLDVFEKLIKVLPMDSEQLRKAIDNPCNDFEDMLQYQCAVAGECSAIITNNKKDFARYSQLPLFTAAEYLVSL